MTAPWDDETLRYYQQAAKKTKRTSGVQIPTADEYDLFIRMMKFAKRVEIHHSKAEEIYSAKDKKTGHEFVSAFGEGIRVQYGTRITGRPRMEFLREKGCKFSNATEFAYEVYVCLGEIEGERSYTKDLEDR